MENTYNIVIYDNNVDSITELKHMIDEIMFRNYICGYFVQSFSAKEELYKDIDMTGNRYDLYFLRISDKDNTIMNYAEILRNKNMEESIVYLTNNINCISNGYKVNILDYLFEPFKIDLLEKIILFDYENNFCSEYIRLQKNSNIFRIKMKNIVCVEVLGRGIRIYMSDLSDLNVIFRKLNLEEDIDIKERSIRYSDKLLEFKKKLNPNIFTQCHQSFIINLNKIVSIKRYCAIVDNGTESGKVVDISKKYWDYIRKRFIDNMNKNTGQGYMLLDKELNQVSGGKQESLCEPQDTALFFRGKKEDK
ncbi:MAG: LytTR family transcriptional regulator DNA-binding domain-containing protein [Anaerocolumna sp.]